MEPEIFTLRGGSLKSTVKRLMPSKTGSVLDVSKRDIQAPTSVMKLINKYRDWGISNVMVGRTPVESLVQKSLDLLTAGKLTDVKRELKYDDLFHLFCVLIISKGGVDKYIRVEKNQVIRFNEISYENFTKLQKDLQEKNNSRYVDLARAGSILNRDGTPKYTLYSVWINMLKKYNTLRKDPFQYDAFNQGSGSNCQFFLNTLITASFPISVTSELSSFINQDTEYILGKLKSSGVFKKGPSGLLSKIATTATDLARVAEEVVQGDGGKVVSKKKKDAFDIINIPKIAEEETRKTKVFENKNNNIMICCKKGCGKTTLTFNIVERLTRDFSFKDKDIRNGAKQLVVVIFTPTYQRDEKYKMLTQLLLNRGIPVIHENDIVENYNLQMLYNFLVGDPHSPCQYILVLDDQGSNLKLPALGQVLRTNRHFILALIVVSHTTSDIIKSGRQQMDDALLGYDISKEKLEILHSDFALSMPFEDFYTLYKYATAENYNFLNCDLVHHKYYKNFDEELSIQK